MIKQAKKSFWRRPEGVTGILFLMGGLVGAGFLLSSIWPYLIIATTNILYLSSLLIILGVIIYLLLDPKMRGLVGYMYKSFMRWITGLFITIDPIAILKNYVEDLMDNLSKMNRQINKLRGEMHKLKEIIFNNNKAIKTNLELAGKAKENQRNAQVILKSRKAGRLKDSNLKLQDLYDKMKIMYRVLDKMYENSEVLVEDIKDQVKVKEQERKAIMASHSAMKSAMNIISGDKDKKELFDSALEAMADDVSSKVGEMERFMEISENFMASIDLQNGVFEEEGLKMLNKWEEEGTSLLLGEAKEDILQLDTERLDTDGLTLPNRKQEKVTRSGNQYDSFFQ